MYTISLGFGTGFSLVFTILNDILVHFWRARLILYCLVL